MLTKRLLHIIVIKVIFPWFSLHLPLPTRLADIGKARLQYCNEGLTVGTACLSSPSVEMSQSHVRDLWQP